MPEPSLVPVPERKWNRDTLLVLLILLFLGSLGDLASAAVQEHTLSWGSLSVMVLAAAGSAMRAATTYVITGLNVFDRGGKPS